MILTRAAFAVLVKFQGLEDSVQLLVEECKQGLELTIPAQEGLERSQALLDILYSTPDSDRLVDCWSDATRMRRWLIQKKQSISEKLEQSEDKQKLETEKLRDVISKVVKKAEFMSLLDASEGTLKADNSNDDSKNSHGSLQKQSSMMARQMSIKQEQDIVFDLKRRVSSDQQKQILE